MNQNQFLSGEIKLSNIKKFIFHFLLALMLAISLTFSQASFAEPNAYEKEIELEEVYEKENIEDAKDRFEHTTGHDFNKLLTDHGIDKKKLEHIAFGKDKKTGNIFVVIKQEHKKESDVLHLEYNPESRGTRTHVEAYYSTPVHTQKQLDKAEKEYDNSWDIDFLGRYNPFSYINAFEHAKNINEKGQVFANKVIEKHAKQEKQRQEKQRQEKQRQEKQRQEKQRQEKQRQEKQRQEKQRQEKQRQEKQRQEKQRQEKPKQERQKQFRQQEQRRVNRVDRLGTRQQKTIKPSTIKPKTQQKAEVITKTKPDIVLSKKDAKQTRDKWYNPQTWFADDSKTEESH